MDFTNFILQIKDFNVNGNVDIIILENLILIHKANAKPTRKNTPCKSEDLIGKNFYVSTVVYSDFCKDSLFDLQRPVS